MLDGDITIQFSLVWWRKEPIKSQQKNLYSSHSYQRWQNVYTIKSFIKQEQMTSIESYTLIAKCMQLDKAYKIFSGYIANCIHKELYLYLVSCLTMSVRVKSIIAQHWSSVLQWLLTLNSLLPAIFQEFLVAIYSLLSSKNSYWFIMFHNFKSWFKWLKILVRFLKGNEKELYQETEYSYI